MRRRHMVISWCVFQRVMCWYVVEWISGATDREVVGAIGPNRRGGSDLCRIKGNRLART